MSRLKVLEAADATSEGFGTSGNPIGVIIDTFQAGANWILQGKTPLDNWVDVDSQSFSGAGYWTVNTIPAGVMRFHGGAVGAQIWVEGATEVA